MEDERTPAKAPDNAGNQGNTSTTDKGKDKVMVYNSDTDSEEADPRYRVGSRFSSYHNESIKAGNVKDSAHHPIDEDIQEVTRE